MESKMDEEILTPKNSNFLGKIDRGIDEKIISPLFSRNNRTKDWRIGFACAIVALALVISALLLPWRFDEEKGTFSSSYSGYTYSGDYYVKKEYSLRSYKATVDMVSSYYSDRSTNVYDYAEVEDKSPTVVKTWTCTFVFMLLALITGIISVITIPFMAFRKVSDDWKLAIYFLCFLCIFTPILFAVVYPWACEEDSGSSGRSGLEKTNYEGSSVWGSCDYSYTFTGMNLKGHALWYNTWGWWLTLIAFPFALAAYYYTKPQALIGLRKGALRREEMLTSDEKLELLRERLIRGEISEATYKELKEEFIKETIESAEKRMPEPAHEAKPSEESKGLSKSLYQEVAKDFEKPIEPTSSFEELKLIKVRCPTCKEIIEIKDIGQRPLEMVCEKCGTKGALR